MELSGTQMELQCLVTKDYGRLTGKADLQCYQLRVRAYLEAVMIAKKLKEDFE